MYYENEDNDAIIQQVRAEENARRAEFGQPPLPPPPPRVEPTEEQKAAYQVLRAEIEARLDGGFDYRTARWDWDPRMVQVIAERRVPGIPQVVLFDAFLSGSWIFDPQGLGELREQSINENHITLTRVSRQEAEAAARSKGRVLPSEEELTRICEGQIGRRFGSSKTREDLGL